VKLSSWEEIGVVEACRKYSLSSGTFYSWKKKFEHKGEADLKVTYDTKVKSLKKQSKKIVYCESYLVIEKSNLRCSESF
jgi:putative transposase